jgi:hypothetical protein
VNSLPFPVDLIQEIVQCVGFREYARKIGDVCHRSDVLFSCQFLEGLRILEFMQKPVKGFAVLQKIYEALHRNPRTP